MVEKLKIDTSKGQLEYNISGSGIPKIVLINGGSGPIEGWMKVIPELEKSASIFSYNRFGVAGSDKPKEDQDGITIVESLREAMSKIGFVPPYLLVGHSLGGLYANLFSRLYPDEVEGVIFLESSTAEDLSLNENQGGFVKNINKLLAMFDSFSPHKKFDEVHFVKRTVQQIQDSDAFPDIPVYVIIGGKENRLMPENVRKSRLDNQHKLLSLTKTSKHIVAEKSGHFPQLSEPRVVIETIMACLKDIENAKTDKL